MNIFICLNKKCNWKCYYCNQGLSIHKEIPEDILLSKIEDTFEFLSDKIKFEKLNFFGGEDGLWSDYFFNRLKEIIKKFDIDEENIILFTNGTLFKRDIFKEKRKIWKFYWHVIPAIDETTIVEIPENFYTSNIYPVIVVGKNDISKYTKFSQNNKHINTLSINKLESSAINKLEEEFEAEDYRDLYLTLLKNRTNIEPAKVHLDNLKIFYKLKKSNRLSELKNDCIKYAQNDLNIDLEKNKIYQCCDYCEDIELTKENLELVINKKAFTYKKCNECKNFIYKYHNI